MRLRDRRRALEAVSALFAPTHVVLDDAFQTWPVARDADIVLLDAEHPLGNGRMIPAGSLREGAGALARADAIGLTGSSQIPAGRVGIGAGAGAGGGDDRESHLDDRLARLREWATRDLAGHPVPVFGIRRRVSIARPISNAAGYSAEEFEGPAAALSSVGRPRRLEESLVRLGVAVGLAIRFPDHYGTALRTSAGSRLSSRSGGPACSSRRERLVEAAQIGPRADVRIARSTSTSSANCRICEKPRACPRLPRERRRGRVSTPEGGWLQSPVLLLLPLLLRFDDPVSKIDRELPSEIHSRSVPTSCPEHDVRDGEDSVVRVPEREENTPAALSSKGTRRPPRYQGVRRDLDARCSLVHRRDAPWRRSRDATRRGTAGSGNR